MTVPPDFFKPLDEGGAGALPFPIPHPMNRELRSCPFCKVAHPWSSECGTDEPPPPSLEERVLDTRSANDLATLDAVLREKRERIRAEELADQVKGDGSPTARIVDRLREHERETAHLEREERERSLLTIGTGEQPFQTPLPSQLRTVTAAKDTLGAGDLAGWLRGPLGSRSIVLPEGELLEVVSQVGKTGKVKLYGRVARFPAGFETLDCWKDRTRQLLQRAVHAKIDVLRVETRPGRDTLILRFYPNAEPTP